MAKTDAADLRGVVHLAGTSFKVTVDEDSHEPGIEVSLETRSGALDPSWQEGSLRAVQHGVRYALNVAQAGGNRARVEGVIDSSDPTSLTLLAAAVAYAVFEALEFSPPPAVIKVIERAVLASHGREPCILRPFGV